jgi:hypothetical protein
LWQLARAVVGARPLLVKIGHVTSKLAAPGWPRPSHRMHALVMVNCISAKVVDTDRQPLFNGEKRGIAGDAIRHAALNQVRLLPVIQSSTSACNSWSWRDPHWGGRRFISKLGHAVQLATAAMLSPMIGLNIRRELF